MVIAEHNRRILRTLPVKSRMRWRQAAYATFGCQRTKYDAHSCSSHANSLITSLCSVQRGPELVANRSDRNLPSVTADAPDAVPLGFSADARRKAGDVRDLVAPCGQASGT